MIYREVSLYKIFLFTFLWISELGGNRARNLKNVDYDFPEADELFANRNFSFTDSLAERENQNFNFTDASDVGQSSSPQIYTVSDSPISYEVPCGIRGGINSTAYNLNVNGHRIVGGIKAHPGEFPWQVSLQLISGWFARHICGGTVLSSYWVVTAGHCVANLKPKAIVIVAGDHDLFKSEGTEQRVHVVRIVNAGYSQENFSSDIALLQLNPSLKLDGKNVAPVCLPNPTKTYQPGEFGIVSGWGKLSEGGKLPHILHFVRIPIMATSRCHKLYDDINYGKYMNKCQICGGSERGGCDSCQGDSGGPLVCQHADKRYYLCGIVSWGVGCARPRLPGVYTEVPCYSNWIKNVLYNVDNMVSGMASYK